MGRRRRRRSPGGVSRRRFLAGGLLAVGGASILGGTQAFSRVDATRASSIQTAGDGNGLLGLDLPSVVPVGVGSTDLVGVTNNTDEQLTASIDVPDLRATESFDTTQRGLNPGQAGQFTASLDVDRATDEDAVNVEVTGSGSGIDIELSRTVPVPSFAWQLFDNTQNGSVQFDIQYDVDGVPDFDSITIQVTDLSENWGPSETFSRSSPSGAISFPDESGGGGADGHDFEVTFEVYDAGLGLVLAKSVTVTADGADDGEGDPGDENDPELDWVFVDDLSHDWDGVQYRVYYQVSTLENFGEVEVTFQHDDDWATDSTVTTQSPVGTAEHSSGNYGDGFDIVVNVENDSGIVVDSVSSPDTADGSNPTNPDVAESDSPTFDTLDVADNSSGDGAEYVVNYTIDDEVRFGEVRAQFENLSGSDQTNETIVDSSGTFTYSTGNAGGDEYRITIRIFEARDGVLIPVESEVYTDVADGGDP